MLKNTKTSYGSVAKSFHWLVFAAFVVLYLLGEIMGDMKQEAAPILGLGKWDMYALHKSIGVTVLAIALARLLWRAMNPQPDLPAGTAKIQTLAAHTVHWMLYVAMLVMPISGYTMSMAGGHGITYFGFWKLPDLIGLNKPLGALAHDIHMTAAEVIYFIVAIHVVAALFHHYVKKNNVLKRMLPFGD